ncbi:unnamed protein product, partial [marine sediment metagenome]
MTTEAGKGRSILVPIDLHGINRESLEILVRIASRLNRSLLGLLLEDIRLQQVADLPFATEITLIGGQERSLLRDHLSQRHSLVTTDTRRLLNELADRNRVELSFESAAGARLHTALERDGHLDIFFPARQRWQLVAATRPLASRPIQRLGIVLANTEQDRSVVETARVLLQAELASEVYVLSVGPLDRTQIEMLYRPGSRICVQGNLSCDPATIAQLIRQSSYDLLLLPGDC